jgi:hypothetical protein
MGWEHGYELSKRASSGDGTPYAPRIKLDFHIARVDVTSSNLNEIHDGAELRRTLSSILQVSDSLTAEQTEIVEDFYFYLFAFAREQRFSDEKTSTLLSICREVFDGDTATNDPAKHMGTSFERLQSMLLRHAVFRPPKSIGVFDEADVKAILNYLLHNYYRHWRLYKVCFTKRLQATFTQTAPFGVEAPAAYRPLAELLPLGAAPDDGAGAADAGAPPAAADDAAEEEGA